MRSTPAKDRALFLKDRALDLVNRQGSIERIPGHGIGRAYQGSGFSIWYADPKTSECDEYHHLDVHDSEGKVLSVVWLSGERQRSSASSAVDGGHSFLHKLPAAAEFRELVDVNFEEFTRQAPTKLLLALAKFTKPIDVIVQFEDETHPLFQQQQRERLVRSIRHAWQRKTPDTAEPRRQIGKR
jgi:hypothetical protein